MALQDLTPQLRTRLNRMERAVRWFVIVAAVLLLVGLGITCGTPRSARLVSCKRSPMKPASAAVLACGSAIR